MNKSTSDFKFCDPLYGYIYFDREEHSIILDPFFQRLRSIQQLSFCQQAFPSAIHNRFAHSLGTAHLAEQAFESIANKGLKLSDSKKQKFKKAVKIAALLHDIGHGPLSHSSECLMPELKELKINSYLKTNLDRQARHEDYGLKIIMETDLSVKIKKLGLDPACVVAILHKDFKLDGLDFFKDEGLDYLPLLRQIISSEVDVDRMDYLHRDSFSCGVRYGLIDYKWILDHFDFHQKENQVFLAIRTEALYTIEAFILARRYMRMIIYFHRKAVIYNVLLKKYAKKCQWRLPADLKGYLDYKDSTLLDQLEKDKQASSYARQIVDYKPHRRLYEYYSICSQHKDPILLKQEKKNEIFKKNKQIYDSLKEELNKNKISYIETNSYDNSIKPSKETHQDTEIKLFLKNTILNTTYCFDEDPSLQTIPNRELKRIYVKPEDKQKAKNLLTSLL